MEERKKAAVKKALLLLSLFKTFIAPTSELPVQSATSVYPQRCSYSLLSLSSVALHSCFSLPFCLSLLSILTESQLVKANVFDLAYWSKEILYRVFTKEVFDEYVFKSLQCGLYIILKRKKVFV